VRSVLKSFGDGPFHEWDVRVLRTLSYEGPPMA